MIAMTLCKFRPKRTYDAQFIIDKFDAQGLVKRLHEKVAELGENGELSTMYYVGALTILQVLFKYAEVDGMVDYPTDLLGLFERALGDNDKE